MNRRSLIRSSWRLAVLLAAVIVAACDQSSAANKLATAEALVAKAPVEVVSRHAAADRPFVYLIGENHASVANQLELVELLKALRRESGVETILVEGSNGPFPLKKIRAEVDAGRDDDALRVYWREQLEWGRIAGYEFVALTTPGVVVHGVEDMLAKRLYETSLTTYDSPTVKLEIESYRLGALRLREGLSALEQRSTAGDTATTPDTSQLREAIVAYEQSLSEYTQAWQAYSQAMRPMRYRAREFARLRRAAEPVFARYGEDLTEMKRLEDALNASAKRFNRLSAEYKRKLKQYNRSILGGRSFGDTGSLEDGLDDEHIKEYMEPLTRSRRRLLGAEVPTSAGLERTQQKLDQEYERYQRLKARYDAFVANDYPKIKALDDFLRRKPSSTEVKAIEAAVESRTESIARLEDAYFTAANRLHALARPLGVDVNATQRFWAERREWLEQRQRETAEQELRERDAAMAENTRRYLQAHAAPLAALIVGYAHLPGMATQLRERGVGFIALRLHSSDADIEPWERRAWEARRVGARGERLFTTDPSIKELSPLLDPRWRAEEKARFGLFEHLYGVDADTVPSLRGLVGDGRVYEGVLSEGRVITTSRKPFDRNADLGDHVLERGPLPGRPGEYYQIIDRQRAQQSVRELSDSRTAYAYAYRTAETGTPSYQIVTPTGKTSVRQFLESPPRTADSSVPERVVLFREPDEVQRGGVVVSPLLDRMRASGTGGPPHDGGSPTVSSAAPEPEPRRLPDGSDDGRAGDKAPRAQAPPGAGGRGTPPLGPPGAGGAPPSGSAGGSHWSHPWLVAMLGVRPRPPRVYQTVNPRRADRNLAVLDRQRGRDLGEVAFVDEQGLASVPFTPRDGEHARIAVFHARNTEGFRRQVTEAAALGKLRNKQVALITCGDAFVETTALREALLDGGALMVWVPERQLQVQQGRALYDYVQGVVRELGPEAGTKTIDELMMHAFQRWQREHPGDPAIRIFEQSGTWVRLDRPEFRAPQTG
ncbi:MAG: hypothetical protein GWN84_00170 [Gammaproteobacteria bacterium]|nr:hypothetical protein [Gammaproteobacteria bacterium]NIR81620.1 hypothetical protein [Gammaproteobacteria bacterium]NIR88171.1 hypothetical protein [Gammaproteobacteria bacterium]NIU02732.1 hypothetical protein [Gammaproteobacteria bacterium]NIV73331.1 hypothetical protein [Gammaproteobacteria bacterium]